jgi:hypothetical protein
MWQASFGSRSARLGCMPLTDGVAEHAGWCLVEAGEEVHSLIALNNAVFSNRPIEAAPYVCKVSKLITLLIRLEYLPAWGRDAGIQTYEEAPLDPEPSSAVRCAYCPWPDQSSGTTTGPASPTIACPRPAGLSAFQSTWLSNSALRPAWPSASCLRPAWLSTLLPRPACSHVVPRSIWNVLSQRGSHPKDTAGTTGMDW